MRTLIIDDEPIDFSDGFVYLHTLSYEEILKGNGFRLSETREVVELLHTIRKADG